LSQPEPEPEFHATPYWCLRQLGIVNASKKGSKEFTQFRQGIGRLAGIRYENDAFYDPIRGEHRQVSFGFLNYSLPLTEHSSRAWRFAWDPIFFELCEANRGALRFDLSVYRDLSPAARRLYLLLKKVFWRNDHSPDLEVRHLAVNILGFSDTLETHTLKKKIARCVAELLDHEIVQLGLGQQRVGDCFVKKAKGVYHLQLHRGSRRDGGTSRIAEITDSPLYDPLVAIGFDQASIRRILATYPAKLIEQWADITLAAEEKKLVQTSPPAYFQYYIQKAHAKSATPPDWWREMQKEQRKAERDQEQNKSTLRGVDSEDREFEQYLQTEAKDAFERVMSRLTRTFMNAGKDPRDAKEVAEYQARMHLRNKFRANRDPSTGWSKAADLLS
jgi:hypothetical protein